MRRPAVVLLFALAPAAALAVALWPATVLLCLAVALIAVLAWRAPAWGLAAAVLLFGFEGSVKLLLWLEDTPLPGGPRAAGAAALDVALLAAVIGVVAADKLATPRALWQRAGRAERVVAGTVAAWLALSVVQIAVGGDISRGVHGFRIFQAYTIVVVGAAIVFARPPLRLRATRALLIAGGLVCAYAAFRTVFGATAAETDFATSVNTAALRPFEESLRTIGSFSSAVGLSSFVTPIAVFALVTGYAVPRLRRLAWAVAVLALVALVGSFTRASLVGLALGLVCALAMVVFSADLERPRKFAAVGLAVAALAATYGALSIASASSGALRSRAGGLLDPANDPSVRQRLDHWKELIKDAGNRPLGRGIGAVGRASGAGNRVETADNSFLKVLVEQGFLGLAVFAGGLLGMIVLLARRLRRAEAPARALGVAALAAFVAFAGIALAGEYVEQPGKVIAWGMLGIALAQAHGYVPSREETA